MTLMLMRIVAQATCAFCSRSMPLRPNRVSPYCRSCQAQRKKLARRKLYQERGRTTAVMGRYLLSVSSRR